MYDADSIIIGSGLGGLATGLSLARAGQKVLILEQHYVPGGWAHSFLREGFKFSPGVHFVGHLHEGGNGREVFEGLGIANDLSFFQQNPKGYDYNIVGDHHFKMPAGVENLKEALSERYPHQRKGIRKYLDFNKMVYKELFVALEPQRHLLDVLTLPYRTRHIGRMGWWKFRTIINLFLKDPYVKTHLSLQCGNYGLPPKLTPFVVHSVVSNHCMAGTHYPRGSGSGLVKGFTTNIKKLGGTIRTSAGVDKILIEETGKGKKAVGVELNNGEKLYAKHIVSNADPHNTYFKMIGKEHLSKKLMKKLRKTKYSVAALNLFMVVEADLRSMGMDSGNIWYVKYPDIDKIFDELTQKTLLQDPEFPALFVSSPTLKDPVSFNGKHHTLEVILLIPNDEFKKFESLKYEERSEEYLDFKGRVEQKMLRTLEKVLPGISSKVKLLELGTPTTAKHYIRSTEGNAYGLEKNLFQVGPFNFRQKTEIENFYLTGAATLSHGLIGAANSGIGTASRILGCKQEELLQFNEGQHLRVFQAEDDSEWPDWLKAKQQVRQRRGMMKSF